MGRKVLAIALLSLFAIGAVAWNLASNWNQVVYLNIGTASKTGEAYPFAVAMQQVIAKHQPNIKLKVIETNGSQENMQLLEQKKLQLALVQSDTPGGPSARAVALLYPEMFHLIVSEKSGINSAIALKGKRIALMPEGSGSYDTFWFLAKHYDLNPSNFQYVALSPVEAQKAFFKGEVDAIFRSLPVGNKWTRNLLKTTRAKLVPIDQASAMKVALPYLEEGTIPPGTYKAIPPVPDRNLVTVGVKTALLAHKDVDPETIRELTQLLYDYRHELVKLEPKAAAIAPPGTGQTISLPLHSGATSYYEREKPSFLANNADSLALILSVIVLMGSWLWSLRSRFSQKQKNRADEYNLEILDLVEQARNTHDLELLETLHRQLFQILRKVVEDLDRDRITPESFQSFTFSWEVAIHTIRHQEMIVLNSQAASIAKQKFK